jgi:hypothetical protein
MLRRVTSCPWFASKKTSESQRKDLYLGVPDIRKKKRISEPR